MIYLRRCFSSSCEYDKWSVVFLVWNFWDVKIWPWLWGRSCIDRTPRATIGHCESYIIHISEIKDKQNVKYKRWKPHLATGVVWVASTVLAVLDINLYRQFWPQGGEGQVRGEVGHRDSSYRYFMSYSLSYRDQHSRIPDQGILINIGCGKIRFTLVCLM